MAKRRARPVPTWVRLDNAAKIYPATRSGDWMAVFRLSVTLSEDIRRPLLQQALEATLKRIPLFGYRLKAGLFWYFMETQGDKQPIVQDDAANPCLPISLPHNDHFMIRVRVHGPRIALELFHTMADATGAMTFLLTLCAEYLRLRHGRRIQPGGYVLDLREAPRPEEWEDSFPKYARQAARPRKEESAYPLRGTPAEKNYLQVTTGTIPTAQLSQLAKRYGCTINTLLAALLLQGMLHIQRQDRSARRARMPLKLSMPVNLRKYYPSKTLRNFSSYINAPLFSQYGSYELKDIIRLVGHYVGLETMEQLVNARFSGNVHAEQMKLLRLAPLFLKSAVLKLMYALTGERYFSSVLSNLGLISLPAEMARHVQRMDFVIGGAKRNPVSCGCVSVGGKTFINFSRTIKEPTLEQLFFTALIKEGVPVTIESNRRTNQ